MSATIRKRQSPITKRPAQSNEALKAAVSIGDDAIFQVLCGNERVTWLGALMRAIQADVKSGKGANVLDLASLGQHIADDHGYAADVAVDLQKKIDELQLAPQNATTANRGARLDGLDLAQRILAAREYASLSQAELAKLVGIEQGAVSQLEGGKTKRTGHLAEIARACGVDVDWLAFGSEAAK